MKDEIGIQSYWKEQTERGTNPCHYHNRWQDAYAFRVRIRAFRKEDFLGARQVIDIGCGIGEYMEALSALASDATFIGFDFPFNVRIARERYADFPRLTFCDGAVPSEEIERAMREADIVYTTTVYVHLAPSSRRAFLEYAGGMHPGAKLMLLEYAPLRVPEFQKGLAHKEVEDETTLIRKICERGFALSEVRLVNYLDSFLFHHFGCNALTYYATLFVESVLRVARFPRAKYRLFIFRKN
jgi:hypothetical protein